MEPLQQILEQAVAIVPLRRAGSEGAAKRRGNSGLVGQVLDADDAPVHLVPASGLLLRVASH